ncbi:hypothetical protein [Methylobacterium sp. J-077]|uniref:hypothetical protein n=1 Tax=Methylobacterium sp. J-077 TaxID=2836656 RepID=UPI001FB9EEA2|nr:hypothetical protein [Methylobacterium sp. J-077]MCJ2121632.1 hypothetical protein [Methylobacterium sp. J-077]
MPPNVTAPKHADLQGLTSPNERVLAGPVDTRAAADSTIRGDPFRQTGSATSRSIVTLSPNASIEARSKLIRERINAAARPILTRFANRRGLSLERLRKAIGGRTPLTHPEIVRHLGGALHSEEMQRAIASHADPGLLPLKVHAGVAKMMAEPLSDAPTAAVREAFPDWNKPLAPVGRHIQPWRPKDAAAWLKCFPPNEVLLHPMDTWDGVTAALWLNDRSTITSDLLHSSEVDGTVVAFELRNPWLPSLEVLHTLDEIEREELTYRVFVERLRREVMPFYLSERRFHIRKAAELVTFGYQTLQDARRSMREHDLRRIKHFDRVFGENDEWISDLCRKIVAAYAWPSGFAEPELWFEFLALDDAPD